MDGLEYLGDGLLSQNLLKGLFSLTEVRFERVLNIPTNKAIGIGLAVVHCDKISRVHCFIDSQQGDLARVTPKLPSPSYARL